MVRLTVLEEGNALDLSGAAQLGSRDQKRAGAAWMIDSDADLVRKSRADIA